MRDKNRIRPFLDKLENAWEKHPDLRFGQLVSILADEIKQKDMFYVEDDKFLDAIQKFIDKVNKK